MGLIERLHHSVQGEKKKKGTNDATVCSFPHRFALNRVRHARTGTCRVVGRLQTSGDESQTPPDSGLSEGTRRNEVI